MGFMDMEKEYYRVNREALRPVLRTYEVENCGGKDTTEISGNERVQII